MAIVAVKKTTMTTHRIEMSTADLECAVREWAEKRNVHLPTDGRCNFWMPDRTYGEAKMVVTIVEGNE